MKYQNGTYYTLQPHPTAPAYHWVELNTEIRAWVENPLFGIEPNQPVYRLCRIMDADASMREAHVEDVSGNWVWFSCPFEKIHVVHDYAPELNTVIRIWGEPK